MRVLIGSDAKQFNVIICSNPIKNMNIDQPHQSSVLDLTNGEIQPDQYIFSETIIDNSDRNPPINNSLLLTYCIYLLHSTKQFFIKCVCCQNNACRVCCSKTFLRSLLGIFIAILVWVTQALNCYSLSLLGYSSLSIMGYFLSFQVYQLLCCRSALKNQASRLQKNMFLVRSLLYFPVDSKHKLYYCKSLILGYFFLTIQYDQSYPNGLRLLVFTFNIVQAVVCCVCGQYLESVIQQWAQFYTNNQILTLVLRTFLVLEGCLFVSMTVFNLNQASLSFMLSIAVLLLYYLKSVGRRAARMFRTPGIVLVVSLTSWLHFLIRGEYQTMQLAFPTDYNFFLVYLVFFVCLMLIQISQTQWLFPIQTNSQQNQQNQQNQRLCQYSLQQWVAMIVIIMIQLALFGPHVKLK